MLITSEERRQFSRMDIDCPVMLNETISERSWQGQAINLSSTGILFSSQHASNVGNELTINIKPGINKTPPLHAVITVVRVDIADAKKGYEIAGEIKEIIN